MALVPVALALMGQAAPAMDPDNPTCPKSLNFSDYKQMKFSKITRGGDDILLAEGIIDKDVPDRLKKALDQYPDVTEIWLRSPGGDARAGNAAGRAIRDSGRLLITRIPKGWACFSACNFVFMGGRARIVEPGGYFIVHMFTMTGARDAIAMSVEEGTDSTIELIGSIEQESALLASEDNDFLIRMGVSRDLLTEVMYRQKAVKGADNDKSTRRCLTQDEALKYNVANAAA
ncbi:MAG: hypothetical protein IE933_11830 [Sphingomonadales bacterium]|nr:hypothetical protein [Sphingomonadales bacterium]MBD3773255.1 hypothetical protein [Paracoccaceae bacterium]